jgi:CBS domain-containing protein
VVENGRPVGLLPFRRVAEVPRSEWDSRTVGDTMLPREQVPLLEQDEQLVDALEELNEGDLHRGLVVDGDRLVGLLSITDLVRALETGGPRRRRSLSPV